MVGEEKRKHNFNLPVQTSKIIVSIEKLNFLKCGRTWDITSYGWMKS